MDDLDAMDKKKLVTRKSRLQARWVLIASVLPIHFFFN